MRPTITRSATHLFAKPKNWNDADGACGDLQVRAETFGAANVIELFSTWKPTDSELAHLNRGGVVEVGLCVADQPAMQVGVVDPVEPVLDPYVAHEGTANDDAEIDALIASEKPPITINEDAHGHG